MPGKRPSIIAVQPSTLPPVPAKPAAHPLEASLIQSFRLFLQHDIDSAYALEAFATSQRKRVLDRLPKRATLRLIEGGKA